MNDNAKIGPNALCSCGSGKKFKKCCMHKGTSVEGSVSAGSRTIYSLSIKERNFILFEAIGDIFGFAKGKIWADLKKEISGDQIKQLYGVIATLWPINTNLVELLPRPSNKLRALYLGYYRPEIVIQNILRYALYTDEIIAILPFVNPHNIAPEHNPLKIPNEYREDTLKNLAFLCQLMPLIYSGVVNLIPDPGEFDHKLRQETFKLARDRSQKSGLKKEHLEEYEPYFIEDFSRGLFRLPKEDLTAKLRGLCPHITEAELEKYIEEVGKRKNEDPLFLDQPLGKKESQVQIVRTGGNLEMGMYIAQLTGAYLYTNFNTRWKEILSMAHKLPSGGEVWSPLANAFQRLEFKFLNNIDSRFANSLRDEGRLESFRGFLRKVWTTIGGSPEQSKIDALARDFSDELKEEFKKAEAEWQDIDKKLIKWVTGTGGLGSILTGGMAWEIPALGFCIAAIGELLTARLDRKRFRHNVPMSVFLDLSKKR